MQPLLAAVGSSVQLARLRRSASSRHSYTWLPAAERCLLCFLSSNVTVSDRVDAGPDIDLRTRSARYAVSR